MTVGFCRGRFFVVGINGAPVAAYLAGFVTMLATGARRQRIGDLAARMVVARAGAVRHRSLTLVPVAIVVLAAGALSACQVTFTGGAQSSGGTQSYRGHGVSFTYPAGWSVGTLHGDVEVGNRLWATAVGPGTPDDLIAVEAYRLKLPVTAQNIDSLIPALASALRQAGATIQGTPAKTTMAGLPAVMFHTTGTTGGSRFLSRMVFAFNGTTEYLVNCQHTPLKAGEVGQACNEVVGSFHAAPAGAAQVTPEAPSGAAAKQRAQSDLMALQHDDSFTADLRTLTSDVHAANADTAALKNDATLGAGCSVVSIIKIDAGTVGIDASTVRSDQQILTIDIANATQDIATLNHDLANLTARGLPAPREAAPALAAASRAINRAIREGNSQFDHVNADVTQAYATAIRLANDSCPRDRPGRAPAPISHIPTK